MTRLRAVVVCVLVVAQAATLGVALGAGQAAAATTYVVSPDGSGDFTTIQAAVDATVDGDTVAVRPGTYGEQVTVATDVTLVAPSGATLDGSSFGAASTGIYVDRNVTGGLTVEGFTVENYGDGIGVGAAPDEGFSEDAGEFGPVRDGIAGGWTIRNVVVRNNDEDGIDVSSATDAPWRIEDVTATGNGQEGIEVGNFAKPGVDWVIDGANASNNGEYGIRVGQETGAWTIRNSITNDNGDGESGVEVTGAGSGWLITGHTATGNDRAGVSVPSSGAGVVELSNLSENRVFGFEALTEADWTLRDSRVLNNDEDGVYDSNTASSFLVDNVTIRGNGHDGVFLLDNSGDWQVLNSEITDNGVGDFLDPPGAGIDAERTSGSWVVNNTTITGNADAGIYAVDGPLPFGDATDNWWGQSSGPTADQCRENVTCTSPLTSDPGQRGPSTGALSGTVTDASGSPLADVDVTVYRDDGTGTFAQAAADTTASDGTYTAGGIDTSGGAASAKVEFAAATSGYVAEWYDDAASESAATPVTVTADATTTGVDAALAAAPPAVVAGTVTNASGAPYDGVDVTVFRDDGTGTFAEYATTTTDATGAYRAEVAVPAGEPAARVTVRFSTPDETIQTEWYESAATLDAATALTVGSGETATADAVVGPRSGYVTGTVTNASGAPLAGVTVTVFDTDGSGSYVRATTNASGVYERSTGPSSLADETTDVLVQFADDEGTYPTEWYDDVADRGDATPVTVERGQRTEVSVTLAAAPADDGSSGGGSGDGSSGLPDLVAAFSGTVTDESGAPVAGVEVAAFREGADRPAGTATTDASGAYTVSVAPDPGETSATVELRFRDPTWSYAQRWYDGRTRDRAETVRTRAGSERVRLDTTMEPNEVRVAGSARSRSGEALEDVRVTVYRRDDAGRFRPVARTVTATDAAGDYETLVPVPDGQATVDLKVRFGDPGDDYAPTVWRDAATVRDGEAITAPGGADLPNVRVTLPLWERVGARYQGTVYDGATPLEDILVTVYRDDGTGTFREWTNVYTDDAGYWEAPVRAPAGAQSVAVKLRYRDETGRYLPEWEFNASSRAAADVETAALGDFRLLDGTRLERAPNATVVGTVLDERFDRLSGAEVTLFRHEDPAGRATAPEFARTTTDANGFYRFDVPAPAGQSTVRARLFVDHPSGGHAHQYYRDGRRRANATRVDVPVGEFTRLRYQVLPDAGMVLRTYVQPLADCPDPTDAESCSFPERARFVTVDPGEEVAVRYELWNGDDRTYVDYDVDDPATRTTFFGAGHRVTPGTVLTETETLTAPVVDGDYDHTATSTTDNRQGTWSNDTARYTVRVTGSVARQARLGDRFEASGSTDGPDDPALVAGDSPLATANGTSMGSLLLATDGGPFDLSVDGSAPPPDGTTPPPLVPGGESLGYFTVEHSTPDSAIRSVTFRFGVDRARLDATGATPDDVTVYRYVDGTPTGVDTSLAGEGPDGYVFETTSPGLSVFVVAVGDLQSGATATGSATARDAPSTTPTDGDAPGFGALAALVALLAAALVAVRRR